MRRTPVRESIPPLPSQKKAFDRIGFSKIRYDLFFLGNTFEIDAQRTIVRNYQSIQNGQCHICPMLLESKHETHRDFLKKGYVSAFASCTSHARNLRTHATQRRFNCALGERGDEDNEKKARIGHFGIAKNQELVFLYTGTNEHCALLVVVFCFQWRIAFFSYKRRNCETAAVVIPPLEKE